MMQDNMVESMILGLIAGDAIGAGCEFYTPKAVRETFPNGLTAPINGGPHNLIAGQLTDDSEMMSCVLRQVFNIAHEVVLNGQDIADVTNHNDFAKAMKAAYREWHYSQPVDCGSTIAAALQQTGIYIDFDENVQGNGALMRVAPIAALFFLSDYGAQIIRNGRVASRIENLATWDAELTHRSRICIDANQAFIVGLYYAMQGYAPTRIKEMTLDFCQQAFIAPDVIKAVNGERQVDGSGWVLNGLQLAFTLGLSSTRSFERIMGKVTKLGFDTDTNCAIVGAMLGARGIRPNTMNYKTIYACKPANRPKKYWAASIIAYAQALQVLIHSAWLAQMARKCVGKLQEIGHE